jgi:hypothetical protein
MNQPTCYNCADYELTPGSFAPGANSEDKGRITLDAGVPYPVTFARISVLNATKWIFAGTPLCYNSANENIGFEITNKTGTGFTVTAIENATFEYICKRL